MYLLNIDEQITNELPKYSPRRHASFGVHTYLALSDFLQFVLSILCQTLLYILQRVQNHHMIESNSRVHCSSSWHTKERRWSDRFEKLSQELLKYLFQMRAVEKIILRR